MPRVLVIRLPGATNANSLEALIEILERFPGFTPVWAEVQDTLLIDLGVSVNTRDDDFAALLRTWHDIEAMPAYGHISRGKTTPENH